jgi:hypothetical protein
MYENGVARVQIAFIFMNERRIFRKLRLMVRTRCAHRNACGLMQCRIGSRLERSSQLG